jgi:hypothetical protein
MEKHNKDLHNLCSLDTQIKEGEVGGVVKSSCNFVYDN